MKDYKDPFHDSAEILFKISRNIPLYNFNLVNLSKKEFILLYEIPLHKSNKGNKFLKLGK